MLQFFPLQKAYIISLAVLMSGADLWELVQAN